MREDQHSATAQRVAMRRAAHQLLDDPRVLDDPFALRIIGAAARAALEADPMRFEGRRWSPVMRASFAVRSRLAEDVLAEDVGRGVRQYVVLGAGLDTFAWRDPHTAAGLRVFEVDHPATQAWKRERLREAALPEPPALTFVPADLEVTPLDAALAAAGFDATRPALFAWLGVTMYLTHEAFAGTLRSIAALPQGSGVVFDYAVDPAGLDERERAAFDALAARVAAAGEPWRSWFERNALRAELGALGFGEVTDLGAEELDARYLRGRRDGLRVGSLARFVHARV